ncbi:MAG: Microcystin dependent protein [Verrucomicrobiaceae bacterium]|nr:Microcystin dependent protein [Verrucomicrobiaceae bacterium]
MADPFIGEMKIFAGNFALRGYALCNGQLISISQNTALFAILGTTYGGNGTTTFALPDLRGRFPIGSGQGAGLSNQSMGQLQGSPTVQLTANNLPTHNHTLQATTAPASSAAPSTNIWAVAGSRRSTVNLYTAAQGAGSSMAPQSLTPIGGGLPHNNMSPYLGLTFLIAMQGIFPTRN